MAPTLASFAQTLRRGIFYFGIILFGDFAAFGFASLVLGLVVFRHLTLLMMLEAAFLFILGGVIDVGGSMSFSMVKDKLKNSEASWNSGVHKKAQSKAAPYVAAGIILFLASFLLAYPLNSVG